MTNKFAAAHPGKMGDALYTLPFIRHIYNETGMKCDFYTSSYCAPLMDLFEYQSCIDKVIIPDNYVVERMDMGCQPWYMPVPDEYERAYQLGFQRIPDRAVHQFIAHEQGVDIPLAVEYEYPKSDTIYNRYVCLAPRHPSSYDRLFYLVAEELERRDFDVVVIGGKGEYIGIGYDYTGASMLKTVSLLSDAVGFMGLMSSQLVLANGFSYPKVSPHDGRSWDMGHVVKQASNHYPINPSVEEVLALLEV